MPSKDTWSWQRTGMLAGLGVPLHPTLREVGLSTALGKSFTVREHHGSDRGGDQQCRGCLESEDVAIEDQRSNALGVATVLRVGGAQSDRRTDDRVADCENQQCSESQPRQHSESALRLDRLDQRFPDVDT